MHFLVKITLFSQLYLQVFLLTSYLELYTSFSHFTVPLRSHNLVSSYLHMVDDQQSTDLINMKKKMKSFSVAPMMKHTSRHFRYFWRLISKQSIVFTEMVMADRIVELSHDKFWLDRYLDHDALIEYPLVLQLGGNDPVTLKQATHIAINQYNYSHINLNCGCPSNTVASTHAMGAALMLEPMLTAQCCRAIYEALTEQQQDDDQSPSSSSTLLLPTRSINDDDNESYDSSSSSSTTSSTSNNHAHIRHTTSHHRHKLSVKCRIGVEDHDSYQDLHQFIHTVHTLGHVNQFYVHARKALLNRSTMENRDVPPLKYHFVYQLIRDFPQVEFIVNGGLLTLDDVDKHFHDCKVYVDNNHSSNSGHDIEDKTDNNNYIESAVNDDRVVFEQAKLANDDDDNDDGVDDIHDASATTIEPPLNHHRHHQQNQQLMAEAAVATETAVPATVVKGGGGELMGVMVGRACVNHPYMWIHLDKYLTGTSASTTTTTTTTTTKGNNTNDSDNDTNDTTNNHRILSRGEILEKYRQYCERLELQQSQQQKQQSFQTGTKLTPHDLDDNNNRNGKAGGENDTYRAAITNDNDDDEQYQRLSPSIILAPIYNLFVGEPYCAKYQRKLKKLSNKISSPSLIIRAAVSEMPQEVLYGRVGEYRSIHAISESVHEKRKKMTGPMQPYIY